MGIKVDLHVHSKYSEHPSEWFLQRIGASESYTEPEFIYQTARKLDMDFVTITDHNRIDGILELRSKHPKTTFMGVETTSYFPEDKCKIHVLIYGFSERQFIEIQDLRNDIYDLREYLKDTNLPHSVAHATYSINGKLTVNHLEKLIIMFDVFEGINGARTALSNNAIQKVLTNLKPSDIDRLSVKYKIPPLGESSWIKGFTGGSDDHAGLFIGNTYTETNCTNVDGLLTQIANKQTTAHGRHNDYKSLALSIYKIAWEFSKSRNRSQQDNIYSKITENIFRFKSFSFFEKLKIKKLKSSVNPENQTLVRIVNLLEKLSKEKTVNFEKRFSIVYDTLAEISDGIVQSSLSSILKEMQEINIFNVITKISAFLPSIFMSLPFVTILSHHNKDRNMIYELQKQYKIHKHRNDTKIFWFTDTFDDLNGVSETLKKIAWLSTSRKRDVTFVLASNNENKNKELPPNIIELPTVTSFKIPQYESLVLNVPSLLKSIEIIHRHNPDEIYISTPGFVGFVGLIAAKLLHIKCVSIFHTDFKKLLDEVINDSTVSHVANLYLKWFYSKMDLISAPCVEYKEILENYGFPAEKITIFKRGIDTEMFQPVDDAREMISSKFGLDDKKILLYTGRISQEKNVDLLVDIFEELKTRNSDVCLLIIGDGPYLGQLKLSFSGIEDVHFTGRLQNNELPAYYSAADIFLFPSLIDTFGMSVLEAQACGLPCIVSDKGGPKEIIKADETGFVVPGNDPNLWVDRISELLTMIDSSAVEYLNMKIECRLNVIERYDWKNIEPFAQTESLVNTTN